jgi:hypothetical protein
MSTTLFERAEWLMRRVAIARRGVAPEAADESRSTAYAAAPLEAVRD